MTTDTLSEAGLKPCPFCGDEAEVERIGTSRASMIVACTKCGGRMESGDVGGLTNPGQLAWNRRAALATQAAPVAVKERVISELSDRRLLNDVDPSLFDEIAGAIIRAAKP